MHLHTYLLNFVTDQSLVSMWPQSTHPELTKTLQLVSRRRGRFCCATAPQGTPRPCLMSRPSRCWAQRWAQTLLFLFNKKKCSVLLPSLFDETATEVKIGSEGGCVCERTLMCVCVSVSVRACVRACATMCVRARVRVRCEYREFVCVG